MPNSYVSRRSTEAQGFSAWKPPEGALGELVTAASIRAESLLGRRKELEKAADLAPAAPGLRSALPGPTVGIIAEIKRASPSRGAINAGLNAAELARAYERGGAAAISVLTESTRFGGSDEDLVSARGAVTLPILKKDFHVAVVQLLEARSLGASAALVIVRAIPPERLREMVAAARDIGLELLVEVHNIAELELAVTLEAELIGVNSRDLESLNVDPSVFGRVIPMVPRRFTGVAESGIETKADVERAAADGADAVLVGASLSASRDPEGAVRSLSGVARKTGAREN